MNDDPGSSGGWRVRGRMSLILYAVVKIFKDLVLKLHDPLFVLPPIVGTVFERGHVFDHDGDSYPAELTAKNPAHAPGRKRLGWNDHALGAGPLRPVAQCDRFVKGIPDA